MTVQLIAQPYIVYLAWSEVSEEDLTAWLEENIEDYFLVFFVANGAWINPARTDRPAGVRKLKSKMMQFQFESPRDALLFKLTWVK